MKNLKPIYRYIIITASYLFVTAIFFTAGYGVGFKSGNGLVSEQVSASVVTASASPTGEPRRYRVILEDAKLRLYSDEDGISRLISDYPISEASFPAHDIAALKEGVVFDRSEDALALMENFLS